MLIVPLSGNLGYSQRYREIRDHQLVGGDGEVAVAEIQAIEIFPSPSNEPYSQGEALGRGVAGAAGAAALIAIFLLPAAGAFMFVPP